MVACSLQTEPMCGCPPARSHGIVTGIVRTASGALVDGASVDITLSNPNSEVTCDFSGWIERPVPLGTLHTGNGVFSFHVYSLWSPVRRCIRVVAEWQVGAQVFRAQVDGAELMFRIDRAVPDTLNVLLVER